MAGHSKWANIQHRKNAQDAKRGKIFTKLIREITVAARMGGGIVDTNPRLRLVMDKALSHNMNKDTIERAIKRGTGDGDGAMMEEVTYEGYGPSGIAVLVHCLTDNRNRTVGEVRHAFTKHGGNLGSTGSVSYLFSRKGVITFAPGQNENKVMEIAIEAGAEDVVTHPDGSIDVMTSPENLHAIKSAMEKAKFDFVQAEITEVPSLKVSLDTVHAEKWHKMQDALEDLDDVQSVHDNAEEI